MAQESERESDYGKRWALLSRSKLEIAHSASTPMLLGIEMDTAFRTPITMYDREREREREREIGTIERGTYPWLAGWLAAWLAGQLAQLARRPGSQDIHGFDSFKSRHKASLDKTIKQ